MAEENKAQNDRNTNGFDDVTALYVRQNSTNHDHTYSRKSKGEPRLFSAKENELMKNNWNCPPELPQDLNATWNRALTAFAFGYSCLDVVYTLISQDLIQSMGDYLQDLNHLRSIYAFEINHQLKFTVRFKCNFGLHTVFLNTSEETEDGEEVLVHMFLWTKLKIIDGGSDVSFLITSILREFGDKISSSEKGPSCLVFKEFLSSTLSFSLYKLEFGGHLDSYFNLPHSITRRKALDPVYRSASTSRDHCFRATILHYLGQKKIDSSFLDMESFHPFMTLKDVGKFEQKHPQLQIFVLAAEMQENNPENLDFFYLVYKSKNESFENSHQINLFLHEEHYYLVSNLGKLLASTHKRGHLKSSIYCVNCWSQFSTIERKNAHLIYCSSVEHTVPSFPKEKLEFTNYEMCLQVPIIIFYDIETNHDTVKNNEKATYTKYVNELKPLKVGLKHYFTEREVLERDCYLKSLEEVKIFTGYDCITHFFKYLKECSGKIQEKIKEIVPLKMSQTDWQKFKSAQKCGEENL